MNNRKEAKICAVLEYSAFYPDQEKINIIEYLKLFDKAELVQLISRLSLCCGNICFSFTKKDFMFTIVHRNADIENRMHDFYSKNNIPKNNKVGIVTYRSLLELLKYIFSIPTSEFKNSISSELKDFLFFKIILAVNEKIYHIGNIPKQDKEDKQDEHLDEHLYFNQYINNDLNEYDFQKTILPQLFYSNCLVKTINNNSTLQEVSLLLFKKWGISDWSTYIATLTFIAEETHKIEYTKQYRILNQLKCTLLPGSYNLINSLSISIDDVFSLEENADYRIFREKPFIKLNNNSDFIVINNQLVCERIFNSLYFEFMPYINKGKNCVGKYDYNRSFIEKKLLKEILFKCIPESFYTFPARDSDTEKEDDDEPDFYYRNGNKVVLIECKSIKINATIKDDCDFERLFTELKEKLVETTRQLDTNTRQKEHGKGIGQLVKHMNNIKGKCFKWDPNVPEEVTFYPILILDDIRYFQRGFSSILNKWYEEYLENHKTFNTSCCKPLMVLSINSLYLYDDLIKRKGLTNMIDDFIATHNIIYKNEDINSMNEFEDYLTSNPFDKHLNRLNFLQELKKNCK